MDRGCIIVAGIGAGDMQDITPAVMEALKNSDVIIGYKYYFNFIADIIPAGVLCVDTGMRQERARAEEAFKYAEQGRRVCVISSGDSGIYGMAPLVCEMKREYNSQIRVEVLPGISAFQKAASLVGAPIGHDFCVISLSDLMTTWMKIEQRVKAAASADFVTAIYNPASEGRYWQLPRVKELFLTCRDENTPVALVRQAGRREQSISITTLHKFDPAIADMFTVIIIGNSQTYLYENMMITPRGYYGESEESHGEFGAGQEIMIRSFRTIERELINRDIPLDKKWAMLHAIHTTADFDMERILYVDDGIISAIHREIIDREIDTIITDVTMVTAGIRAVAAARYGLEIKCYLHDPRTVDLAKEMGITRTQAGIRLAVKEHPSALYVFGNAPTALMELCRHIKMGRALPAGVIAAPVGFVNVCESKYMIKSFAHIPKIIVEGRKGGSNIAATLVNAILSFEDAEMLLPGRDV